MDNWIQQAVKIRRQRHLRWWALLLICALGFVGVNHRYARDFLFGPFELSAADLEAITEVDSAPMRS